jgi:hypothetical protein
MNKPLVTLSLIIGAGLMVLAVYYVVTPAHALPSFFPGFDATSAKTHYKHGVGAFILGLGAFAFAWFQSGTKPLPPQKQD